MENYSTATKSTIMMIIVSIFLTTTTNAVPATRDAHIVRHDLHSDITEFCKETTNPTLCVQTIQPHLIKGAVEPLKALEVEVDATLGEAKKTLSDIKTLETKQDTTKSTKESLSTCKEQYKSMLDAIAETKVAIAKKDVITAKFKFSAVLSYQAACQDAFDGDKIPFPQDSDAVFQLGGNCLDIIADINKATPLKALPPPVQQTPSAFSNVIGTVS